MMRAAAPFSFFSFRKQQRKKKKKQPKTSLPKSPNFKAPPPYPQLRVQETKHLWENTKLGGDEN